MSLETAVRNVRDFNSLLALFRDQFKWEELPLKLDADEITFEWSAGDLNISDSAKKRLNGGTVRQLQPLSPNQPWGIFFVEFEDKKVYRGALRQVVRGLVPKQRRAGQLPTWEHDNLLFICATKDYDQFTFAHFRGQKAERAVLSTFSWQLGDTHIRTLCEFNLPALSWPQNESDRQAWLKKWSAAFDVEKVTDEFFRRYNEVFTAVEGEVKKTVKDERKARLFTQKLFNRLMFIYFIQKKGWLSFKDHPKNKFLRALFDEAVAKKENFFSDRLYWLFFRGMSIADMKLGEQTEGELRERRGDVPPLNGGLFELEDELDTRGTMAIPNDSFARIFDLFERYNFTIEESTPLDVQVAVDPEMLGKVFEELVTGRHETGSYYTPRPIVSFMCREALKHYLAAVQPNKEAVAQFVDEEDARELENPEVVLEALKRVLVCDPACGSGAYLLGMLHELMRLRAALFKSNKIDDATHYERKRWIIENNLYGVDNDAFAVQIACLRLWLSLAIDSDEPRPLPNLDYKIEVGDSLIAPAPSESEKQMTFARTALVNDFRRSKGEYMREDDPERKQKLRQRIEELRSEIALALKHRVPKLTEGQIQKKRQQLLLLEQSIDSTRNASIKTQLQKQAENLRQALRVYDSAPEQDDTGFDWAVEFAEVFMPAGRGRWLMDDLHPILNDFKRQGTLVEDAQPDTKSGGFDIIVANPPYIEQRSLPREYKQKLRLIFEHVYSGTADLLVYFFARAAQLLRPKGVGAFISSNKWLLSDYGEKIRQQMLDGLQFHFVVDFGDQPVFKASAYPCIFLWQQIARGQAATELALVEDLELCYAEGIREHVMHIARTIPASAFGTGKLRVQPTRRTQPHLSNSKNAKPLSEFITDGIYRGVITGLNEVFFIDRKTRDRLIHEDRRSIEVIKPMLLGEDIRRYEINSREQFLVFTRRGIDIKSFSAVLNYLKPFRVDLKPKQSPSATRGRKPGPYEWYEIQDSIAYFRLFDTPKIIYPQIMMFARFYMDAKQYFITQKCFMIPNADWYMLGVLNSNPVWQYIKTGSPTLRGGYSELRNEFVSNIPIPDAPIAERKAVAKLAQQTQELHTKRRKLVEKFLHALGIEPADSSSRNPLEQPWAVKAEEFMRRTRGATPKSFTGARDETYALTEQIAKIEREIDERVAALYGVPLNGTE